MELSPKTYRLIVKYVGARADLSTLCRVNKGFQQAAERALYSIIHALNSRDSFEMCSLFAKTPRLAVMVETMFLFVRGEDDTSDNSFPNDFWLTVSRALHQMTGLRSLNLDLEDASDAAQAWILKGTTFRLRSFHCDMKWDDDLASFLNIQSDIEDLFIADYLLPESTASTSISSPLGPGALPNLSALQCTFAEAACALVPSRPISRLKTCFSKTRLPEKREELSLLISRLMESTSHFRTLDIADSSYSVSFSMELLAPVVRLQNKVHDLRYLGTVVLPVDGNIRLKFYGLLRRFSFLECIEMEVSEWDPPPTSPARVRALASELRLYCPLMQQVIFVKDFERTIVAVVNGTYTLDNDSDTETIWRKF